MTLLLLCTAACSTVTSNGLMEGASPETSVLTLSRYDGNKTTSWYSADTATAQDVLDRLDQVKVAEAIDWSIDKITLPIYGLYIAKTDGYGLFAAWSNGYWITQDGMVYKYKFDFSNLTTEYSWTNERAYNGITYFPNAWFLTHDYSGWYSTLLTPAGTIYPPAGITMTLESQSIDSITIKLTNETDEPWMFGEHFSIQVLLGDLWYEIPTTPGHWAFNDIGLILNAGAEQTKTYGLLMYGNLPAGLYRLVSYNLSVEFTV